MWLFFSRENDSSVMPLIKTSFSFYNSNSILKFTFTVLRTDIRLALKSTEDIENGGGSILHNVTCEVTKCDFMCDISNLFQILMH